MPTKRYKSTSPGLRSRIVLNTNDITNSKRNKRLTHSFSSTGGRNNTGRVTVRGKGSGVKKLYRFIDFKRNKTDVKAIVTTIEYDPNRNAKICLLNYVDGEKRYIIKPNNLNIGDEVISSDSADIQIGNCLPLSNIPEGTVIHNIEFSPLKGAQISRSAGAYSVIQAKSNKYATVKLSSGEVRLILLNCKAVIGSVDNSDFRNTRIGKAGANRWKGRRPHVRGAAMNCCDHPHGGGEGKAPVGLSGPKTPWGKPALGKKTRKKKNKFILKGRK